MLRVVNLFELMSLHYCWFVHVNLRVLLVEVDESQLIEVFFYAAIVTILTPFQLLYLIICFFSCLD